MPYKCCLPLRNCLTVRLQVAKMVNGPAVTTAELPYGLWPYDRFVTTGQPRFRICDDPAV